MSMSRLIISGCLQINKEKSYINYLSGTRKVAFSPTTIFSLCFQQKINSFTYSQAIFVGLASSLQTLKCKPCAINEANSPISIPIYIGNVCQDFGELHQIFWKKLRVLLITMNHQGIVCLQGTLQLSRWNFQSLFFYAQGMTSWKELVPELKMKCTPHT